MHYMWVQKSELFMHKKVIIILSISLYTVSNRNAGRTVETPELRSYNAEFRSFSMDSPPFLVFWLTVGRNYHFLKILGYVHRTWKVAYPDLHALF